MFVLYVVDYQGNSTYREDHVLQGVVYEDREDAQAVADKANQEAIVRHRDSMVQIWEERGLQYPEPTLEAAQAEWGDASVGFTYVDEWEFERTSKPWDHVKTVDPRDISDERRPPFISFENKPYRQHTIPDRRGGCVNCGTPIVRSAGATTWHALGSGTTHCHDGFTARRHEPEQRA